jgi:DNA-binding response OmpR family regulator
MKNLFVPASPVLSVSSLAADHLALRRSMQEGAALLEAANCAEAAQWLGRVRVAAVVCDETLPDGGWQDLLSLAARMDDPPPVLVTSRLADERLWAAVLELGGYDLLRKPFDPAELVRVWGALGVAQATVPPSAVRHAA